MFHFEKNIIPRSSLPLFPPAPNSTHPPPKNWGTRELAGSNASSSLSIIQARISPSSLPRSLPPPSSSPVLFISPPQRAPGVGGDEGGGGGSAPTTTPALSSPLAGAACVEEGGGGGGGREGNAGRAAAVMQHNIGSDTTQYALIYL